MAVSAAEIKRLRDVTGSGIGDCKKALEENDGDFEKALDWLRAKGIAKAAKKADRVAAEGLVECYVHSNGRIGVLVEVNCETDFVPRTEKFKELVHDIALHIAASSPLYVAKEDVPPAEVERERQVQIAKTMEEGKPKAVAERIVEGRMSKYFEDVCLLEQRFVKDDSMTIRQLVTDATATIGEKIAVRRFTRYVLGEGIEKKVDDFAAEVMAQAGLS